MPSSPAKRAAPLVGVSRELPIVLFALLDALDWMSRESVDDVFPDHLDVPIPLDLHGARDRLRGAPSLASVSAPRAGRPHSSRSGAALTRGAARSLTPNESVHQEPDPQRVDRPIPITRT